MDATLFISYPHSARQHMLLFRRHLEGLLFGKAVVWSDQAIARGKKWETQLRAHLKHADAALLLVTPEFLASTWCRRELTLIASEQKAGRLKKVFWVQIEPCGWRGTELGAFQSWAFNMDEALSEIADANARARTVVRICEEVAAEMDAVGSQLDSDLVFVRQVIMDQAIDRGLVVDGALADARGTFWTCCRGRKGAEDVVIKVLRRSQIKQLAERFSELVEARKGLTNQCFIRVLDHFQTDPGHEQYTVVVEEFVGSEVVRLDHYLKDAQFRIDEAAVVLRRAAEALKQFHDDKRLAGTAYGLLASSHVYYDQRGQKLLLPAVGVSNFLWDAVGWERLASWQDEERNPAAYLAPEVFKGEPATHLTDQYMLGQLGLEMLQGQLPFDVRRPSQVRNKESFWDDPEGSAASEWVEAHRAFAKIVFRMLRRDPAQRWESFDELIRRLRTAEDENRALAKRTFEGLGDVSFRLKDNRAFFESFYREFLDRAPEAADKFKGKTDQPKKLMDAMTAVLNFRASNEPTALREIVNAHRHMEMKQEWVTDFRDAFLDTLRKRLPRGMSVERREKILGAWRDLFSPVVEYFTEELFGSGERVADTQTARQAPGRSAVRVLPMGGRRRRQSIG
jgi:hypothetical protein